MSVSISVPVNVSIIVSFTGLNESPGKYLSAGHLWPGLLPCSALYRLIKSSQLYGSTTGAATRHRWVTYPAASVLTPDAHGVPHAYDLVMSIN